jgi:hypothetical protein
MANKGITITVTNWGTTLTPLTDITITANTGTTTPSSATLASLTGGTIVTVDEAATSVSLTPVGECSGTTQTFNISSNPSAEGVVTNYYRMGNCNEVQYSYTATTNTGFGIIVTPGCATAEELETLIWSDPAHTTYVVDYDDPCPLPSFTGTTYVARYTGGTVGATAVYEVTGVGCLSIISGETGPSYTVNLNNETLKGSGIGACSISPCDGNFIPTLPALQVAYDAETCGTLDRILVAEVNPFDIFGGPLNPNEVYGVNIYDVTGAPLTGYCATIVSAYTENVNFYTSTGTTFGNTLINPAVGANIMTTGVTCGTCDANYYLVGMAKNGGCEEGVINNFHAWTTSGLSIGDVITVTGLTCTDHFCCYTITYVSPGKLNRYGLYNGELFGYDYEVFRVYDDCPTCTGDTFQNVTAVTGSTASPNEFDDGEVSASITLDTTVDVNTSIVVEIATSGAGSPYNITISIPSGSSSGSNTYNTGATDPGAANSACVVSSNNPLVDFGVFGCSP